MSVYFSLVATVSTHSRPKAAGPSGKSSQKPSEFQHTAARRRLAIPAADTCPPVPFQHTAARRRLAFAHDGFKCAVQFQHTAARRRLGK
nr:MAG TPA: hypothetical protein [Herelleviridae sp.]